MDSINKLDVIFFGAHPDDIELTCGGTAAKLVKSGRKTGIIDLTRGELSTRGTLETRAKETKKATETLGIDVRENLGLKDGSIVSNEESRLKVITAIRKYKPEIIFAPYPFDRHPDHINASSLLRESFFYSGLRNIVTEGFEAYRAKKLYYYPQAYDIPISFIIDISDTFTDKIEAIKCYGTQFYDKDSKSGEPQTLISSELFYKQIESRARNYGFKIGAEYGEAFYSDETIKITAKTLFEI